MNGSDLRLDVFPIGRRSDSSPVTGPAPLQSAYVSLRSTDVGAKKTSAAVPSSDFLAFVKGGTCVEAGLSSATLLSRPALLVSESVDSCVDDHTAPAASSINGHDYTVSATPYAGSRFAPSSHGFMQPPGKAVDWSAGTRGDRQASRAGAGAGHAHLRAALPLTEGPNHSPYIAITRVSSSMPGSISAAAAPIRHLTAGAVHHGLPAQQQLGAATLSGPVSAARSRSRLATSLMSQPADQPVEFAADGGAVHGRALSHDTISQRQATVSRSRSSAKELVHDILSPPAPLHAAAASASNVLDLTAPGVRGRSQSLTRSRSLQSPSRTGQASRVISVEHPSSLRNAAPLARAPLLQGPRSRPPVSVASQVQVQSQPRSHTSSGFNTIPREAAAASIVSGDPVISDDQHTAGQHRLTQASAYAQSQSALHHRSLMRAPSASAHRSSSKRLLVMGSSLPRSTVLLSPRSAYASSMASLSRVSKIPPLFRVCLLYTSPSPRD